MSSRGVLCAHVIRLATAALTAGVPGGVDYLLTRQGAMTGAHVKKLYEAQSVDSV